MSEDAQESDMSAMDGTYIVEIVSQEPKPEVLSKDIYYSVITAENFAGQRLVSKTFKRKS